MWIAGAIGCYMMEFILTMCQYHSIKKYMKESIMVMVLRYIVLLALTGWLIYGNVLYYNKGNVDECANGLRLGVFLLLLFGYFEMMKCCCLSLFVCIMIPFLFFHIRRA